MCVSDPQHGPERVGTTSVLVDHPLHIHRHVQLAQKGGVGECGGGGGTTAYLMV